MNSAIINKGSQVNDILGLLTGEWSEFDRDGWHIVKTPFFVSVSAVVEKGSKALPFSVKIPTAGILFKNSNSVEAVSIMPGDTAASFSADGLFKLEMFGNQCDVSPIL